MVTDVIKIQQIYFLAVFQPPIGKHKMKPFTFYQLNALLCINNAMNNGHYFVKGLSSILNSPKANEIMTRKNFHLSVVTAATTTAGTTLLCQPFPARADPLEEDGYITTPRGVKYKVVKPPNDENSPSPKRAQKVKAFYTLYLNGFPEDVPSSTKIDSSKGFLGEKPFEFLAGVSQVIKGWDLAIMDMKVGEARKLIITSDLGYGDKGAGGRIPGKATLYFDIELLDIGAESKLGPEQYKWLEENPL